jgi:hypothetical protein
MSISRIVTEIDAYLFRLRQARELLAGSEKAARQRHAPRKRVATRVTEAISAPSPVVRIQPIRVRQKAAQQTMNAANKAVDLVVMPDATTAAQDVSFQPEAESLLPPIEKDMQFAAGRTRTENAERQQSGRQERATALEQAKPMNAISGSPSSRVVVVSAEEVRKAREQAAHFAVKRPRVSVAGLTGRKAFEALFNDESNSSATPSA